MPDHSHIDSREPEVVGIADRDRRNARLRHRICAIPCRGVAGVNGRVVQGATGKS